LGVENVNAEQREPAPHPLSFEATMDPVELTMRKKVSPEQEIKGSSALHDETRTRTPPQIKSWQMKKLRSALLVLLSEN